MNRNSSGRRYDREFKNNAVALVRGGRTITEVARDLGVSKWSLGHWVRQAEEGQLLSEPKTLALETPEQRELRPKMICWSPNVSQDSRAELISLKWIPVPRDGDDANKQFVRHSF
jgi:transposase-like protein